MGFVETFNSSPETLAVFPFKFKLIMAGQLEAGGSCSITPTILNQEIDQAMPIAFGLHPYFKVPHDLKKDIDFRFFGGRGIREDIGAWANGNSVVVRNPRIDDARKDSIEVFIPCLGRIWLDIPVQYQRIIVWSQPGKDFVCIEPFMGGQGGIFVNPLHIKPGGALSTRIRIHFEPC